jgi:nitroreductase
MSKSKDGELSPLGSYEPGMNWNPVEKVILERRSIRIFKDKPVPDGLIRRVLEAGRFAPTAGNSQPCEFMVV